MGGRLTDTPHPFAYPETPHLRRHGPRGYADYESYRPWLRDEFSFRCVFCLGREQWSILPGAYDIDHFVPQSIHPEGRLDYDNLLYVCHSCNLSKSDRLAPDPCSVALGRCLEVHTDGTITALTDEGQALIDVLGLDNAKYTRFRHLWIDILRSLAIHDRETFIQGMRYPDDLPDLSRLRPPGGNIRPEGINNCFYALRARGKLPETY
jgi:hypothetical protein